MMVSLLLKSNPVNSKLDWSTRKVISELLDRDPTIELAEEEIFFSSEK